MTDYLQSIDPDEHYFLSGDNLSLDRSCSDYLTVSDFNDSMDGSKKYSIFNYNVRSFRKNFESFMGIFSPGNFPDVVVFTETWFEPDTAQGIPGYQAYHSIRVGSRSGGVSVYVRDNLKSKQLVELSVMSQQFPSRMMRGTADL